MEWLLGIFAWLGAFAALLTIGEFLDRWLKESTKLQLTNNLTALITGNMTEWLRATNRMFLAAFDRVYGGKWNLLEQVVWCGLLASPVYAAVVNLINIPLGNGGFGNDIAATALILTISLGCVVLFGLTSIILIRICRDPNFSIRGAVRGSILGGSILGIMLGVGVAKDEGIGEGIGAGFTGGIFGASIGFGIGGRIGSRMSRRIGTGIVALLGFGITAAISFPIARGLIKVPINPWKALVSSLLFLIVVSIIWDDVGRAFLQDIRANPFVLSFVAFNVFADGVSLWETRWILGKGATAKVPALLGLLVLDLVLSGIIYLVLPLALWPQILDFWEAVRFENKQQPWLGLLFWTTFSTSFIFYAFVLAALLVRPLRALTVGFGWIGNMFDLEQHPVRCLSVAMALVVTLIFGGVGVWEFVGGFLAAPVAAVP